MTLRIWLKRFRKAFYYKIGMRFPYSKVRVWAMRKLGYQVGCDVYIPNDLIITQNFIDNKAEVVLGDRVSIAPRVMLLALSHANASNIRKDIDTSKTQIIIGDDCWLGERVSILKGSIIGDEVIVGYNTTIPGKNIQSKSTVVSEISLKTHIRQC